MPVVGPRRWLAVMVALQDGGAKVHPFLIRRRLARLADYVRDMSFGATTVDWEIHDWVTSPLATKDLTGDRKTRVDKALDSVHISSDGFDGRVVFFNYPPGKWDGGSQGANIIAPCTNNITWLAHELTHGYHGPPHSHGAPFRTWDVYARPGEYGHPLEIMSADTFGDDVHTIMDPHAGPAGPGLSGWFRRELGWIADGQVESDAQTISHLQPLSDPGARGALLRIANFPGGNYVAEHRTNVSWDGALSPGSCLIYRVADGVLRGLCKWTGSSNCDYAWKVGEGIFDRMAGQVVYVLGAHDGILRVWSGPYLEPAQFSTRRTLWGAFQPRYWSISGSLHHAGLSGAGLRQHGKGSLHELAASLYSGGEPYVAYVSRPWSIRRTMSVQAAAGSVRTLGSLRSLLHSVAPQQGRIGTWSVRLSTGSGGSLREQFRRRHASSARELVVLAGPVRVGLAA